MDWPKLRLQTASKTDAPDTVLHMGADVWQVAGAYEAYVGRWSRPVADAFLKWLEVPPGGRWLDAGCGTGALSSRITGAAAVIGVDPSGGFLAEARKAGVRPVAGDAAALPFGDGAFDAVVSGLALNFVGRPGAAVAEFARVARPGATVAAYVWDYAAGMAMMRYFWDAATEVDRAAADRDESRRFPFCRPAGLRELWAGAGLAAIETARVEVPTVFRDFDDYWQPFLGGQGAAPAYVATLGEEHRNAIRNRLRAGLPISADGSIALTAVAFAVRGSRS
jgi:SAM-dependent methyltransferase